MELEFKHGDTVTVTENTDYFPIGTLVTVTKVDRFDRLLPYYCVNCKGKGYWLSADQVTAPSMENE